jgi:1-acyl-sn-glycerol-3-phosphate acyltransferase
VGAPTSDKPALYVANHISYLDVFVLGKVLRGSFAAKSEVASWPVFGSLAKLGSTLFLERNPWRAAKQIEMVRGHLQQRGSLIMFPEGTSGAGTQVMPFRSSLFAAADNVTVQPVS